MKLQVACTLAPWARSASSTARAIADPAPWPASAVGTRAKFRVVTPAERS